MEVTYEVWSSNTGENSCILHSIHKEKEGANKALSELVLREITPVFVDKVIRTRERTHGFVV